ncbi:hypothetical protein [Hansschlegelia sp. KR7-227]|uniref:hypothetical protein n=1 Tax=Hansschlegelia sp. KR7-227 TaxID=3400914 RepID=UPI003C09D7E6
MTKLTANVAINMKALQDENALTVNFEQFSDGFFSNVDATQDKLFTITGETAAGGTAYVDVSGQEFEYLPFPTTRGEIPTDGVITGLEGGLMIGDAKQVLLTIDDFRLSVDRVGEVALSDSTKDDAALVRQLFQRADSLVGSSQTDYLIGYDGNDTLDGGAGGADTLAGGNGLDTASWAKSGRLVQVFLDGSKAHGSGATGDVLLNIENLEGSRFGDGLHGDAKANVISGKAGNDLLWGQGGKDTFVFDTALNGKTNVDSLRDFEHLVDRIALDRDLFEGIVFGKTGLMASKHFYEGSAAHDLNDRIIYNSETGRLFYDADGNKAGGEKAVAFAIIAKQDGDFPTLSNLDFFSA